MLLADLHVCETVFRVNLDQVNEEIRLGRVASRNYVIKFYDYEAVCHRFERCFLISSV
jgi:hypothetical protein